MIARNMIEGKCCTLKTSLLIKILQKGRVLYGWKGSTGKLGMGDKKS
jgi:hypothetical protein